MNDRDRRALVICSRCSHAELVGSVAGLAPTPKIVRAVCERDPCAACGRMTMEPIDA